MSDLSTSLNKYLEKIGNAIRELQIVEKELQGILNKKNPQEKVNFKSNFENLNSDNLISKDSSDEIKKDTLREDTIEALEQMLDDDDMWTRRINEHKKILEHEKKPQLNNNPKINNKKSEKHNNLDETEEPLPCGITPDQKDKDETKNPPINALTRLSPDEQNEVLFNLYREAKAAVEKSEHDEANRENLIFETTNKLLEIWIKNN